MMKKIVYIACFILCFSCSNNRNADRVPTEEKSVEAEDFKVDESSLIDDADGKTDTKKLEINFSLDDINTEIEEKLQANYEATILAIQHPEFQEAIKEQLANSGKFNFTLSDSIKTIEIKEIERSGNMLKRNDSITTQKILYTTFINSKYTQKDSALVVIKRTMIVIDNQVKMNTSFSFESLK
ncbi:hypothetical protein [Kordia sp.]|uniref:hypothetical protein n=1 Tax=Kordia sp. TaxID=1965332 RepID=UPI003D2B5AD3